MKKSWLFLTAFVALLFSCSNLTVQAPSSECGSLVVDNAMEGGGRAIAQGEIKSAIATVYGKGISAAISADATDVVNGRGSVKIDGIPAGQNRIVRVAAKDASGGKITEYVISAVTSIEADTTNSVSITWGSTVRGDLYYSAYRAMDVSDSAISEKLDAIAQKITESKTHASLVDFTKIADSFDAIDASSFSVDSYLRKNATVTIKCYGVDGASVFVSDPASSVKTVSGNEATLTIANVLTGEWGVYKKLGDSYTKVGVVKVGESGGSFQIGQSDDDEPTLPRNEETEYDGIKVLVNKAKSSTYSYIWYWDCLDSSGKPMTEYPDSEEEYKWEAFEKLSDDGTYYYKEFKKAYRLSVLIVTSNGSKLYTTGNDSADGSNLTAPGIYEITSSGATKQAGTGPAISLSKGDGTTFNSNSLDVVITANNCTTARYTVDGTNPYSSKTAVSFSGTKSVSLGAGLSVGEKATLRVYGDNGEYYTDATATYEKVEKSVTPTRLGAYYTSTQTAFSIWSPDSSNVTVTVTPKGGVAKEYPCTKGFTVDGGYPDAANIYGVSVPGDLHLAEYQFKINGVAVRDPYGKMIKYDGNNQKSNKIADGAENGYNYTSYAGPSVNIVIDMDRTEPQGGWAARPALENRCDAIVYEVHVGDFTSDATWNGLSKNKGKFPGMVESGTSYSGVATGLDHLKELGVTHVQLLPMYDFATKYNNTLNDMYNWGYDPVNYNVPEDRYSTCPGDYVERIREVKEMINEFHKNGIRVIMDVVYNHTFAKEMFTSISSKYYTTTDLSGCGNSTNTGVPMVSRMIRDSLEYWTEEYNLDGFRFDLIGIYHTSAVKEWGEYLNNTKFTDRNLLMYGEPWNGYATDSEEGAKVRMSAVASLSNAHVGVFNGKFRQSLKGANDKAARGYIFNANEDDGTAYAANIAVGLKGSGTSLDKNGCSDTSGTWTRFFTVTPDQSINYMYAHDNLCSWDKIKAAGVTGEYAKRIVKFGHGILLVSQGIPFIHAGDEFLRTKEKGAGASMSHNSYMAGVATNSIDWSLKKINKAVSDYHADLIKLRKEHDGLRFRNGTGTTQTQGNAVIYRVQDTDGTRLCIVVNPENEIPKPQSGTTIFDINGTKVASSNCEGTAVTVIQY